MFLVFGQLVFFCQTNNRKTLMLPFQGQIDPNHIILFPWTLFVLTRKFFSPNKSFLLHLLLSKKQLGCVLTFTFILILIICTYPCRRRGWEAWSRTRWWWAGQTTGGSGRTTAPGWSTSSSSSSWSPTSSWSPSIASPSSPLRWSESIKEVKVKTFVAGLCQHNTGSSCR